MSPHERKRWPNDNWYRDVWLFLVTLIVLLALHESSSAIQSNHEGRRAAVNVTCATLSAVIESGRETLQAGAAIGPPRFERELRRIGLPPLADRQRGADLAAARYSKGIATEVERQSGVKGLVLPDGRLDCSRLRTLARTR
jgi:hypothetical protein